MKKMITIEVDETIKRFITCEVETQDELYACVNDGLWEDYEISTHGYIENIGTHEWNAYDSNGKGIDGESDKLEDLNQ